MITLVDVRRSWGAFTPVVANGAVLQVESLKAALKVAVGCPRGT